MDKQPVGQLPDLTQSNNDDEIMVITNDEYNQLKKEKISDFITDLQSTNTNNSLTTGSDGKLFVSKTINASDVDGVLSLDNIPQLTTNKLPETGISADNYTYPSSITVNDRGQVVSIVEGSAAEAGAYLDQSQITNCILEAPNGVATFSGSNITLKQGLKMLYSNGRNIDKTLKNGELTLDSDTILDLSSYSGQTFDFELMFGCNINDSYLSQNYQESDVAPTNFWGYNQIYLNTTENQMYFYISSSSSWQKRTLIKLGKGKLENGVVTSFKPYNTFHAIDYNEAVKRSGDTITGTLTVINNGYPKLAFKNPDYSISDGSNELPSDIGFGQMISLDKNNAIAGVFQTSVSKANDNYFTNFGLRRIVDGETIAASAGLSIPASGTSIFYFDVDTLQHNGTTIRYVKQSYINGTSWYRVWSDGWIEQGGRAYVYVSGNNTTINNTTISFLKAFANTNYTPVFTFERYSSESVTTTDDTTALINAVNTKSINVFCNDAGNNSYHTYLRWQACGY